MDTHTFLAQYEEAWGGKVEMIVPLASFRGDDCLVHMAKYADDAPIVDALSSEFTYNEREALKFCEPEEPLPPAPCCEIVAHKVVNGLIELYDTEGNVKIEQSATEGLFEMKRQKYHRLYQAYAELEQYIVREAASSEYLNISRRARKKMPLDNAISRKSTAFSRTSGLVYMLIFSIGCNAFYIDGNCTDSFVRTFVANNMGSKRVFKHEEADFIIDLNFDGDSIGAKGYISPWFKKKRKNQGLITLCNACDNIDVEVNSFREGRTHNGVFSILTGTGVHYRVIQKAIKLKMLEVNLERNENIIYSSVGIVFPRYSVCGKPIIYTGKKITTMTELFTSGLKVDRRYRKMCLDKYRPMSVFDGSGPLIEIPTVFADLVCASDPEQFLANAMHTAQQNGLVVEYDDEVGWYCY